MFQQRCNQDHRVGEPCKGVCGHFEPKMLAATSPIHVFRKECLGLKGPIQ